MGDMTRFFLVDPALKSSPTSCTPSEMIADLITNSKFTQMLRSLCARVVDMRRHGRERVVFCGGRPPERAVAITASKVWRSFLLIPYFPGITIFFTLVGGSNVSLLKRRAVPW